MIPKNREVKLKNGKIITIRSVVPSDAEAITIYRRATSSETHFLARYPEEVSSDLDVAREYIENANGDERGFQLVVEDKGKIVGSIGVNTVRNLIKYRHRCEFGIGILQAYTGIGMGSALLTYAIEQAKNNGYELMELTAFADNLRAIELYKKFGFVEFGRQPKAYKLKDGTYVDDIYMELIF